MLTVNQYIVRQCKALLADVGLLALDWRLLDGAGSVANNLFGGKADAF